MLSGLPKSRQQLFCVCNKFMFVLWFFVLVCLFFIPPGRVKIVTKALALRYMCILIVEALEVVNTLYTREIVNLFGNLRFPLFFSFWVFTLKLRVSVFVLFCFHCCFHFCLLACCGLIHILDKLVSKLGL